MLNIRSLTLVSALKQADTLVPSQRNDYSSLNFDGVKFTCHSLFENDLVTIK